MFLQITTLKMQLNILNKVTIYGILAILMMIGTFALVDSVNFAFAAKNPQAECINGQNQGFIGKEQSGDAYKSNKDVCQQLPK
jgi:hypothetical protein